jgi:hypothetical protein
MSAGVIRAIPPGGKRGSIGVVLVLVVFVALPDTEPPEPDAEADGATVIDPDCEGETVPV